MKDHGVKADHCTFIALFMVGGCLASHSLSTLFPCLWLSDIKAHCNTITANASSALLCTQHQCLCFKWSHLALHDAHRQSTSPSLGYSHRADSSSDSTAHFLEHGKQYSNRRLQMLPFAACRPRQCTPLGCNLVSTYEYMLVFRTSMGHA